MSFVSPLVKTSAGEAWTSKYTTEVPADKWMLPEYNDESWKDGVGSYGYTQGERLRIPHGNLNIWVRREFELEKDISNETIYWIYPMMKIFYTLTLIIIKQS